MTGKVHRVATPSTAPRRVVGPRKYVQYEPRPSALRCTAPDAAPRQTFPATALARGRGRADPGGAARAAGDGRADLARRPEDTPHAAAFADRLLEQGPAAAPVLRPLVLELLRSAPATVRAAPDVT
ncbi:hypothetical protein [Streptomyces sp. ISL-94]|uniref:hypothetical protein n=1 Tax=Streptomyces sp. ISL-94 TaxID=2819190 RepID=UPI001BE6BF7E|nr:hypothetical protein [Streptomyces sp. ISL-94]MBT2480957.1 hypothetical protein [Streptomyces sp. ISL-94]